MKKNPNNQSKFAMWRLQVPHGREFNKVEPIQLLSPSIQHTIALHPSVEPCFQHHHSTPLHMV